MALYVVRSVKTSRGYRYIAYRHTESCLSCQYSVYDDPRCRYHSGTRGLIHPVKASTRITSLLNAPQDTHLTPLIELPSREYTTCSVDICPHVEQKICVLSLDSSIAFPARFPRLAATRELTHNPVIELQPCTPTSPDKRFVVPPA